MPRDKAGRKVRRWTPFEWDLVRDNPRKNVGGFFPNIGRRKLMNFKVYPYTGPTIRERLEAAWKSEQNYKPLGIVAFLRRLIHQQEGPG